MRGPQAALGPRLKTERERRGIPLESIADSTKIKLALLAGLERGDVSQWPGGIFRRAYVRTYAAAIGLDPETVLAEFLRAFPERGTPEPDEAAATPVPAPRTSLRLTLVREPHADLRRGLTRAGTVGLELAAVLATGAAIALLSPAPFWTASGIVALVYYPLATACFGSLRHPREMQHAWQRLVRAAKSYGESARRKRFQLIPRSKPRAEIARISMEVDDEFTRRRTAAS